MNIRSCGFAYCPRHLQKRIWRCNKVVMNLILLSFSAPRHHVCPPCNCETQSHTVHWLSISIFTCSFVCLFVCSSVRPHGNISIYLHWMMFYTIQTIYFLKAHHLVMIMTKSYKKTNTKTKTHRHIQRQKQSASKTQCMLYLSKAGSLRI